MKTRNIHPTWPNPTLDDTQPTPTPDDVETGPLPGETGDPTNPAPRTPTGMTPTAGLPRPIPPPERTGYVPPVRPSSGPPPRRRRSIGDWLLRGFFLASLAAVVLFFILFAAVVTGYALIAAQLPPPEELIARQSVFVSSKIYDRNGDLLYEVVDPQGGRRTYVPLEHISPYLIQATIATEDADFYRHPGFDPIALLKMVRRNILAGEGVSGASTITQQVARNLLLSPEERFQRTVWRKIKEIVLAFEITRRYPRDQILEIYLNENNYGNLAYGVQAAAETYFGVNAADLTLAQASFLAGLPQSPATYDVFGGGRDRALARQRDVLRLMVQQGYISQAEAAAAAEEIANYEFHPPVATDVIPAPHFVTYVRQVVEAEYGPEALYRGSGLRIYTTLDPDLQAKAEQVVAERVADLAVHDGTNGALVAIEPSTGYILAMVGSADFYNEEIDGQVNVALRERQPGSSIKPLTYAAAFEQGWTPATLIWDLPTEFPDGANPPYVPRNYDERFHGPVLVRDALANSYNIPAVKALQFIGVPALKEMAARLGVTTLTREDYGLSLTLGGGEVRLLELTGAYAVFANNGVRMPPTPILRIEDSQGNVLVDHSQPVGEQVLRPEHAYLITSILSDRQARCPAFGCPNNLELSRPAAAKTGTTNDYRDAWTIGYTPDLVVGVWVGNSDNSPMVDLPGSRGAAPIWHDFMEAALAGRPVRNFVRPEGIAEMEICADSGTQPSPYCPRRKMEIFAEDQPPLGPEHDWYQLCQGGQVMVVIADPQGREWAQAQGLPVVPPELCAGTATETQVRITFPAPGSTVSGVVPVIGTVSMPNFDRYVVQYGVGANPQGWGWISGPHLAPVQEGQLTEWDTTHLSPGLYTLRVTAWDREGHQVEGRVQCSVGGPTETPSPTPTPEPTDTPAPTTAPTGTPTSEPTWTPTPEPTDT
ncbi:MAG TPA: PBP1A family penicillin-binding protein, partial [Anaerolineae bacterium]|nr:PBP1A family penicillin-binding protein [Anaerolineae bacterium]